MSDLDKLLIAPCGINCAVCSFYLAYSHNLPRKKGRPRCAGCRRTNRFCAVLKKNCPKVANGEVEFCYECESFPCHGIDLLERRYGTLWNYSVIENLALIKEQGAGALLLRDRRRFQCGKCGDTKSVHNGKCYHCENVETWKG